jgi:hypothetical protein
MFDTIDNTQQPPLIIVDNAAAAATTADSDPQQQPQPQKYTETQVYNSTFGMITQSTNINEMNLNSINQFLDNEKKHNKTETWIRLNKTEKIQKLHQFAEKYGKDNSLPTKDIRNLKTFFTESLNNNKLQKTKDVLYDKDNQTILNVPSLFFNTNARNFTLKIVDVKRVSTIKYLTPKKEKSADSSENV